MGIFGDVTQKLTQIMASTLVSTEHVSSDLTLFCVIRNGKLFPISLPCVTSYINEMQKKKT